MPGADMLAEKFGPIFNFIYVKSDNVGRVLAYIGLYNTVYWRIVIAESGGAPNRTIGLVSNPLEPSEWAYLPDFGFNLEIAWLEFTTVDDQSRDPGHAIGTALREHLEKQRDKQIQTMLSETLREHNIGIGDVITEEAMSKFVLRFTHWALRIPTDRPVSEAELQSLLPFIKKD